MTQLTTDIGEEYLIDEEQDGDTVTFLLFDNDTDSIGEEDDLADITTEPDDAEDYDRQSSSVSTAQLAGSGGGDYGYQTDADVVFSVSDNTETVDAIGFVATFESSVAGDSSPEDHLIGVDELASSLDLTDFDEIEYEAGDLEHVVSGS